MTHTHTHTKRTGRSISRHFRLLVGSIELNALKLCTAVVNALCMSTLCYLFFVVYELGFLGFFWVPRIHMRKSLCTIIINIIYIHESHTSRSDEIKSYRPVFKTSPTHILNPRTRNLFREIIENNKKTNLYRKTNEHTNINLPFFSLILSLQVCKSCILSINRIVSVGLGTRTHTQ